MVRAPCCDKERVKRGQWTEQEDQILTSYIQEYGHGNWRALPKKAGLQRCGKSCRLRWVNYLRPGVKRGNFSREEEDAIIALHQQLGNRWSMIASQFPGRTDNEIKNVWNTYLKKRLCLNTANQGPAAYKHRRDHGLRVEPNYAPSESSIDMSSHNNYLTSEACESIDRLVDYSWEQLCELDDLNMLSSQPMEPLDTSFDRNYYCQLQTGHELMVESNLVSSQRSIDISSTSNTTVEACDSTNGLPNCSWEQSHELDDSNRFSSQPVEPFVSSYDCNQECLSSITWEEEEWDVNFWKRVLTQAESLEF